MRKTKLKKWITSLFASSLIVTIAVVTASAAVIIAATVVIVNVVNDDNQDTQSVIAPESVPNLDDHVIEVLSDGEVSKLESPRGGGSVSIAFSDKVMVNIPNDTATIYFQNPAQSNQDMVVQVIIINGDKQVLVAQSEKIASGYLIQTLKLDNSIKQMLQDGTYNGIFNVLFYNQETGEKAVVNSNIPVEINVSTK